MAGIGVRLCLVYGRAHSTDAKHPLWPCALSTRRQVEQQLTVSNRRGPTPPLAEPPPWRRLRVAPAALLKAVSKLLRVSVGLAGCLC